MEEQGGKNHQNNKRVIQNQKSSTEFTRKSLVLAYSGKIKFILVLMERIGVKTYNN